MTSPATPFACEVGPREGVITAYHLDCDACADAAEALAASTRNPTHRAMAISLRQSADERASVT